MQAGFIYILQNQAYGRYVVKIGRSRRCPDIRAREIFSDGSGVPIPFDIAVSFSVVDCEQAEKNIHRRLRAFRLNNRREFFYASPSIASAIAMEECIAINSRAGAPHPETLHFSSQDNDLESDNVTNSPVSGMCVEKIPISKILSSPIGTSELTLEQLDRVKIISMMLDKVFPSSAKKWQEDFSRDNNPENEIRIWEEITKAYLSIEQIEISSADQRNEAFSLLLARSAQSREEVLAEFKLAHLSYVAANSLLKRYKLNPRPIVVERIKKNV